jgi:hypothetical protein
MYRYLYMHEYIYILMCIYIYIYIYIHIYIYRHTHTFHAISPTCALPDKRCRYTITEDGVCWPRLFFGFFAIPRSPELGRRSFAQASGSCRSSCRACRQGPAAHRHQARHADLEMDVNRHHGNPNGGNTNEGSRISPPSASSSGHLLEQSTLILQSQFVLQKLCGTLQEHTGRCVFAKGHRALCKMHGF